MRRGSHIPPKGQTNENHNTKGTEKTMTVRLLFCRRLLAAALLAVATLLAAGPAQAQDDSSAELAKKLQNPVASLISVPLQSN